LNDTYYSIPCLATANAVKKPQNASAAFRLHLQDCSSALVRDDGAVGPGVLDELLHFIRLQDLDQRLDLVVVLVSGLAGDDVDIRVGGIGGFEDDSVLGRGKAGLDRVVAVDGDQIALAVLIGGSQQFRLHFRELQVLRIGGDVFDGGGDGVHAVLQRDQIGLGQDGEDAAVVADGVGDDDRRAVRNVIDGLDGLGIEAERLDVHAADIGDLVAVLLDFLIEERNMLEVVGVNLAVIQRLVEDIVVVENRDLEVDVVLLKQNRLGKLQNLGVGIQRGGDLQNFRSGGSGGVGRSSRGGGGGSSG